MDIEHKSVLRRKDNMKRIIENSLIILTACMLMFCLISRLYTGKEDEKEIYRFKQKEANVSAEDPNDTAVSSEDEAPETESVTKTFVSDEDEHDPTGLEKSSRVKIGMFTLSYNRKSVEIGRGIDDKTLSRMPGWDAGSALPGGKGVCVIYGHRNREHLRLLKGIKEGETISISFDGKESVYTVTDTDVMSGGKKTDIPFLDGRYILISTCYPFRYTGHAPKKLVVLGKME